MFSYMVEEVAVAAVTNHEVILFLHRPADVSDKAISISEPVWFDQRQTSARGSWLFIMWEAQRRHPGTIWSRACLGVSGSWLMLKPSRVAHPVVHVPITKLTKACPHVWL